LPSTISLIRRGGARRRASEDARLSTGYARASSFWLSPIGLRKSSSKISPGVGFGKRSASAMSVDDFDMRGASFAPDKANAPLIVDPD
jgi:hypothetical protein